jgi:hypothetical protein
MDESEADLAEQSSHDAEKIKVYHGTHYEAGLSIMEQGLLPNQTQGAAFVTTDRTVALMYAQTRTAYRMVHHRGRNRGVLITLAVARERLTPIEERPNPGSEHCLAYRTGYWLDGGSRPGEIVDAEWYEFPALKTPAGVFGVYRTQTTWDGSRNRPRGWVRVFLEELLAGGDEARAYRDDDGKVRLRRT